MGALPCVRSVASIQPLVSFTEYSPLTQYMFGVVEPHYIVDSKDMPDIIETGHNFCSRLDPIVLRSVLPIWEVSCIRDVRE